MVLWMCLGLCAVLFFWFKSPKTEFHRPVFKVEIFKNVQKPSNLIFCVRYCFYWKKARKNVFIVFNDSNCVFNTSYLTDSYIVFTLKTESESKITIFGLKMMVKSGLKNVFEIPPCRRLLSLTSKKCPKSQIQ